jgi:hypothetical protein
MSPGLPDGPDVATCSRRPEQCRKPGAAANGYHPQGIRCGRDFRGMLRRLQPVSVIGR